MCLFAYYPDRYVCTCIHAHLLTQAHTVQRQLHLVKGLLGFILVSLTLLIIKSCSLDAKFLCVLEIKCWCNFRQTVIDIVHSCTCRFILVLEVSYCWVLKIHIVTAQSMVITDSVVTRLVRRITGRSDRLKFVFSLNMIWLTGLKILLSQTHSVPH